MAVVVVMDFIKGVFKVLMLVAAGCVSVARVQVHYWPHGSLQDHQYKGLKPSSVSRLHQLQALQGESVLPTEAFIPVTESIETTNISVNGQFNQTVQEKVKELSWKFPAVKGKPEHEPDPQPEHFGTRQLTPYNSLAVKCGEKAVLVEVKLDFFGTGQRVEPSTITLGDCVAAEVDFTTGVLVFQSALENCNSLIKVTEEALVYVFSLVYKPPNIAGMPIVRTRGTSVHIECRYTRKHMVSSSDLKPTWMPYTATTVFEDFLVFSLQLMTDDWKMVRRSGVYFLGEVIKIEASVLQFNHLALRVFVDNCVATGSPNANSDPRYTFIENHGCFTDGEMSNSSFLPRQRSDKLQLQLEAFQFQEDTGSIYITCLLKATPASMSTDVEHKACSFKSNRWSSADGSNRVCNCCNESCERRKTRDLAKAPGLQWKKKATLGPIFVKEL